MDVGAILSRAFNLYKRNLIIFLPHLIEYVLDTLLILMFVISGAIILLMVLGSLTIASVMSLLSGPTPLLLIAFAMFAVAAFFFAAMVLNAFARAAVIGMVIEAKKVGKTSLKTGIESAKRHGFAIFGYTLAISLIPAIVIGLVVFAGIFFAIFLGEMGGGGMDLASIALIIFLVFLALLAYIIIYVLALFTPQKIVVEKLGVIDGIKASFAFVREYPTEVVIYIGVAIALATVTSIASMVFAIPGVVFELMEDRFIATFFNMFQQIVSLLLGLLLAPYLKAVKTLMVMGEGGEESESRPKSVLQASP